MAHLSPADLMDVVDGCASRDVLAHATTCERCRCSLRDAERGAALARRDRAPEPSPLFWPQLSARVMEAVAREGKPGGQPIPAWWRLSPALLAMAAALMLAVGAGVWSLDGLGMRSPSSGGTGSRAASADRAAAMEAPGPDASWEVVATIVDELGPEAGGEMLTAPLGAADRALPSLSDAERVELARLLKERLGES